MSVAPSSSTTAAHPRGAAAQLQAGVREKWFQQLLAKGSSWGEQLDGKSQEERDQIGRKFREQCGAKQTAGIVRAEVLRVHRARKSACHLHVAVQLTYDLHM